jgi:hypothetical protein
MSTAYRLLGLRVRISTAAWMLVCCECCVLSSRGLCDGPIHCPEECYQLWCVIVCDLETSRRRRPWPALGCCASQKQIMSRSRWPRGIKRSSAAAKLPGSRVWIPLRNVRLSFVLIVLCCIGRGLCDWPVTCPGNSYRVYACPILWWSATVNLNTYNGIGRRASTKNYVVNWDYI